MNFFTDCKTIDDLKSAYKKRMMQYHPDRNKAAEALEIAKAINAQYDEAFKRLKDIHKAADGKTYKKQTKETPEQFKNIISVLCRWVDVKVELIGSWIWVTGNTIAHKEDLKKMKFRFSAKKCAWYFHDEEYKRRHSKTYTLDEIRSMYDTEELQTNQQKAVHA